MKIPRRMTFAMKRSAQSNGRYAGENVKYSDTETPIPWYRPHGSATYRVFYGDLHVEDVSAENLLL